MSEKIKSILSNYKTIAIVGVSKDEKKRFNNRNEVYAKIRF